jgi:phytoene synthase
LDVRRYGRYEDLRHYMDGSACAVGEMMAVAIGISMESELISRARALGEAMQMTNFLRDVGEDARRGRIYLPQEDLDRFSVSEDDVMEGRWSERFNRLMEFEIERTRELYHQADPGIRALPSFARRPVLLARILYSRILDRLEAQGRNPFVSRARTSRSEKLFVAARVMLAEPLVLRKLARRSSKATPRLQ